MVCSAALVLLLVCTGLGLCRCWRLTLLAMFVQAYSCASLWTRRAFAQSKAACQYSSTCLMCGFAADWSAELVSVDVPRVVTGQL